MEMDDKTVFCWSVRQLYIREQRLCFEDKFSYCNIKDVYIYNKEIKMILKSISYKLVPKTDIKVKVKYSKPNVL